LPDLFRPDSDPVLTTSAHICCDGQGHRVLVTCPACTMQVSFRLDTNPDGTVAADTSLVSTGIHMHLTHGCVGT
jgi:hypothetical protein